MSVDFSPKAVIFHIINGTLETNLCRICLKPFGEVCESIFTEFWLEKKILSVADILKMICKTEFSANDNYNVCSDCIVQAFTAYNFYVKFKTTTKLLEDYIKELEESINAITCNSTFIEHYEQIGLELKVKDKTKLELEYDAQNFLSKKFEICPDIEIINDEEKPKQDKKVNLIFIDSNIDSEMNHDEFENVPRIRKMPCPKNKVVKNRIDNKRKSRETVNRFHLTNKPPKQCKICELNFRHFHTLFNHSKKNHDLSYCDICPDFYKIRDLELHIKMHGNVHCCDTCKIIFRFRNDFINHLQCHERKYICDKCGYITKSPDSYKNHFYLAHNGRDYTCTYCGKQYLGPTNFNRHIATHKILLENADKNLSKREISMLVDEATNRKFSPQLCTECGASFVNQRVLLKHIRRKHTKDLPFICEFKNCGARFPTQGDRERHMTGTHKPPTRRCPLCSNVFSTISCVNQHIERTHLKMKKREPSQRKHFAWGTSTVPFEQIRVDIQHKIVEMAKAGELELPEEMLTDNLRKLLNITMEQNKNVFEHVHEQVKVYAGS